ncbi:hypothetical protein [Brevibacillus borstelensis]|uniref:hypothetical protein n=1 Tax=Brevibacillus borstelensis TaxID=45462 RepID=UPI0030C0242C
MDRREQAILDESPPGPICLVSGFFGCPHWLCLFVAWGESKHWSIFLPKGTAPGIAWERGTGVSERVRSAHTLQVKREDESGQVCRVDLTISNFLSMEGGSKMDAVSVLLIAMSFAIFYGVVKFCEAVVKEQEGKKE